MAGRLSLGQETVSQCDRRVLSSKLARTVEWSVEAESILVWAKFFIQGMTKMNNKHVYGGIDVGKDWLDFAVDGIDKITRFGNHPEGISKLVQQIESLQPKLIAVEASGGYENAFVDTLMIKSQPVAVVNPTRVRALARAKGLLAKTDKIDARNIASYAYSGETIQ
jgi:hypothetical protein